MSYIRCNGGNIGTCLGGQSPAMVAPLQKPGRTRIIGGQTSGHAEGIVHFAKVGSTSQDVAARIKGVMSERIARALPLPGFRHQLHEAHGPCTRYGVRSAAALLSDYCMDPCLWQAERPGCLAHMRIQRGEIQSGGQARRLCMNWQGNCCCERYADARYLAVCRHGINPPVAGSWSMRCCDPPGVESVSRAVDRGAQEWLCRSRRSAAW